MQTRLIGSNLFFVHVIVSIPQACQSPSPGWIKLPRFVVRSKPYLILVSNANDFLVIFHHRGYCKVL